MDFGGIAKGYAVDRAVAILRGWGIHNVIVEAGGDLYALGRPDDAAGWKIGVKNPAGPGLCAVFELADRAVATSGNYATRRVENARAMTDTFDPRTGEPVETFLSTTACAPTCMEADAASTVLFCAGTSAELNLGGENISVLNIARDGSGLKFIASDEFPAFERA